MTGPGPSPGPGPGPGTGKALSALPYTGGKNGNASTGTGRWINSLLPVRNVDLFAEPYAGMLGILLQRRPAKAEWVNDLDGLVVNWWRTIADPQLSKTLANRLAASPHSAEWFYEQAQLKMSLFNPPEDDNTRPDVEVAYWTTLAAYMGQHGIHGGGFVLRTSGQPRLLPDEHKIRKLHTRIRKCQITRRPAVDVIRRAGQEPRSLIYCDPPYPTSSNLYRPDPADLDQTANALLQVEGLAAVSGQDGDPWDNLLPGWYRTTRQVRRTDGWMDTGGARNKQAVEVLWTNYPPSKHQPQLDLQ